MKLIITDEVSETKTFNVVTKKDNYGVGEMIHVDVRGVFFGSYNCQIRKITEDTIYCSLQPIYTVYVEEVAEK